MRAVYEDKKWTPEHIEKTIGIIMGAKDKKSNFVRALDSSVYWIALVIAVIGNFAVSIVLIPLLMMLSGIFLYVIIIVLGLSIGFLFEIIIRDIEHLEIRHHLIIAFIIPLIIIINMVIIAQLAGQWEAILMLNNPHSPLIVGAVYGISFIAPYIYYHVFKFRTVFQ